MAFGEDAKKARIQLIAELNARLTRVKEAGREGERDELSAIQSGYGDCRVEINDPIRPFQIARWGKGGGTLDRYQRRHAGNQDTSTMAIPMGGRQEQLQVPELGRDVSITPTQTGHSSHPHPPSQPHSQMRPPPPTPTWAGVVAGRPASILPPHSNPQSRLNVTPTPLAGPGPPGQAGSSKKQKPRQKKKLPPATDDRQPGRSKRDDDDLSRGSGGRGGVSGSRRGGSGAKGREGVTGGDAGAGIGTQAGTGTGTGNSSGQSGRQYGQTMGDCGIGTSLRPVVRSGVTDADTLAFKALAQGKDEDAGRGDGKQGGRINLQSQNA